MHRLVVAADGSGDFTTVQGAVDFVPDEPAKRTTIFIRNGDYEEIVSLNGKSNLILRGESRDKTVVHYANNSSGKITTTDQQRANPSRYNTYLYEGLPPGPISNPGRNSLEAAVAPSSGSLLYWVTTNPETGETKFASTMDGHNANVAEFQRWCQAHPGQC